MPNGIGSKRAQHLRRLAKRRKRETQAAESEEAMLPLSLLQRVDADYDSDSAGTGTQNAATLMQAAPAVTRIPARLILILK